MSFRQLSSICFIWLTIWFCVSPTRAAAPKVRKGDPFEAIRAQMVEKDVKQMGVKNPRVLRSMVTTPRHEFIDARDRNRAYLDMALPIGSQQTISSPYIVAVMTEAVDPQPDDVVLEIGTGSGYQAAILSSLVKQVYTIEIQEPLGLKAAQTFKRLGYRNITAKIGDGYQGWPEHAPFDKIIVTCSPEKPPQPLLEQLKDGGLMVIPVGERYQQTLYLYRKQGGKLELQALQPTFFVPMTGVAEDSRQVKPDRSHPALRNGDFETPPAADEEVAGWFYERQCTWEQRADAPQGQHCITFRNQDFGRASHLLQGFPIDGSKISEFDISAQVRCDNIRIQQTDVFPAIAVTFYDENRREVGTQWIGPFRGTADWTVVKKRFRVPPKTHDGMIRVGLFGATGELSVDDIQLVPVVERQKPER